MHRSSSLLCVFVLMALLLSGCGKREKSQPEAGASPTGSPGPEAIASPESIGSAPGASASPALTPMENGASGVIAGSVSFKGAPPKPALLDMSQDPGCPPDRQPAEVVVVKGGKLANVFVYVKSGLSQASFP